MPESIEQLGDECKTTKQLIVELTVLRHRAAELEAAETRYKHAEATLREIEEKYQTLVERSLQGIFIAQGPPFHLVFVNPTAAAIWGYTPEELTSIPPEQAFDLLHPDDHAVAWQRLADIWERKALSPYELRLIRKDGTTCWAMVFGHRIEYQGEPALQVAILDITKRKQAEEVLRRERDLVARIMETSPAGITVVNREGQIVFANPHAERVLGLTRDEITQRAYNAPEWRITDYDGQPFSDEELPFQRVMRTGQPVFDVRHAIEWPDGQRILLSVNAAPLLDESGQVDGMVATVEDITSSRQAERDREQLIVDLQEALTKIKTLRGLIPICAACKKIRDDQGYWNSLEAYIQKHSDAVFTHSICPDCARKLYPDHFVKGKKGSGSN